MEKIQDKRDRFSNLELLRILAALFVIIIHYNNTEGGKAFLYTEALTVHYQILLTFEMMAICAVNIFVMLSGYFLCTSTKVSMWKVLRLYIDVVFISVLRYLLYCILGTETFHITDFVARFIPLSWYTAVYVGLYLISPYLNQIIRGKTQSEYQQMLLVFLFVCSLWPSGVELLSKVLDFSPKSFSPISAAGSGDGYTLLNFILMYFLGAYLRFYENKTLSTRRIRNALIVYFLSVLVNTAYANRFFGRATSYCNPFVVAQAVSIFVIFQNIRIQSKAVNLIASSSFGVYLMHTFFFPWCQIEKFVTGNPAIIPIHMIACVVLIYAACTVIYLGYRRIFTPVFVLLEKKFAFLTYEVN